MDTPQEQHDTHWPQTDPQLDALLDEALATPMIPPSPDLTQRIVDKTRPMLDRQPVLARIGPTLLRIAAAVAIVAGAGVVTMVMTHHPAAPPMADTGHDIDEIVPGLQALNQAVEPGNTLIDEQMDMLSLRVELVSTEDTWSAAGRDTNSLIDQAVTVFEVDQLNDDTAFIWADGSTLF